MTSPARHGAPALRGVGSRAEAPACRAPPPPAPGAGRGKNPRRSTKWNSTPANDRPAFANDRNTITSCTKLAAHAPAENSILKFPRGVKFGPRGARKFDANWGPGVAKNGPKCGPKLGGRDTARAAFPKISPASILGPKYRRPIFWALFTGHGMYPFPRGRGKPRRTFSISGQLVGVSDRGPNPRRAGPRRRPLRAPRTISTPANDRPA